jgi:hypothetical protein
VKYLRHFPLLENWSPLKKSKRCGALDGPMNSTGHKYETLVYISPKGLNVRVYGCFAKLW